MLEVGLRIDLTNYEIYLPDMTTNNKWPKWLLNSIHKWDSSHMTGDLNSYVEVTCCRIFTKRDIFLKLSNLLKEILRWRFQFFWHFMITMAKLATIVDSQSTNNYYTKYLVLSPLLGCRAKLKPCTYIFLTN